MKLLIISNYWHFEDEKNSSRYLSIANIAADAGIDVEVITSTFYHTTKKQRTEKEKLTGKCKFKTTLIYEKGYKRNVDINRILSHRDFAKNVNTYLESIEKPDAIYLFVPSLSLGKIVSDYCRRNNVRLIIDVLDLWPEAFNMLLPAKNLMAFLLRGMQKRADYIYRSANQVITVSDTYMKRVLSVNSKYTDSAVVFIGSDMKEFDRHNSKPVKREKEIVFVYIGMLGKSYDLTCAIDAMVLLKKQGIDNAKLLVMGDGPLKSKFEEYAASKNITHEFTGRLPYPNMVERLVECDVALNMISKGAVQSIINKHADYLFAGLPIINNQEVAEFGNLLDEYQCGLNCKNSDATSVALAMKKLIEDKNLRIQMGKNARVLAENKFNRDNTYNDILRIIRSSQEV